MPQGLGETRKAQHHGIVIVGTARSAVVLGLGEGDALLQVRTGHSHFSDHAQDISKHDMRIPQVCRVVDPPGQAEHVLPGHCQVNEKSLSDAFPLRKAEVVGIAKIQGLVKAQNPL